MAIFFSIIFTGLEFVYFGVDSITATTRADPPYSVAANSNTLGKIRLPPWELASGTGAAQNKKAQTCNVAWLQQLT
jgi:hypothetical protein